MCQLLNGASQRVSTLKQTSLPFKTPHVKALIDKLCFELPTPLSETELKTRLRSAELDAKLRKLRDRRWYIQVGSADSGIYFGLGSRYSPYTTRLISRPSAFETFSDFHTFLNRIFNLEEINSLKITRLDLAIDYQEDLPNILRGFDFRRKQTRVSYSDKRGQRTGICVGQGNEKILVYDKANESNLPNPLTRIEIQLSGSKLPTRNLDDLQKALIEKKWNPFNSITLHSVILPDNPSGLTTSQQKRLSSLSSILNREGLFSAKRALNDHRNFERDYKTLFQILPWPEQPSESFQSHIGNFFNPDQKEPLNERNNRKTEAS